MERTSFIIRKMYNWLHQTFLYSVGLLYFLWNGKWYTQMFGIEQSDELLLRLIRYGYNVNVSNELGETALHVAVSRPSTRVVQALIKSGADINAQDRNKRTPLRHAVRHDNLEAVCMLLYHGADVNIVCTQGITPFTYAIYAYRLNIAWMLMDYYDDFSTQKCHRITALHLAVAHDGATAIRLLNRGANVNCITRSGQSLLEFSLRKENAELFKFIWSRIDPQVLLEGSPSFLVKYVSECSFLTDEWLECLYVLLGSPIAKDLVLSCNEWMDYRTIDKPTFFKLLATAFNLKEVKFKDRITIIYICLNLGAQANIYDTNKMNLYYGFKEELEALIDVTISSSHVGGFFLLPYNEDLTVSAFILCVERNICARMIFKHFIDQVVSDEDVWAAKHIVHLSEFFAVPSVVKQTLRLFLQRKIPEVVHTFDEMMQDRMSDVPSLLELSRQQARVYVKQTCECRKPKQFHNAVRNLKVPLIVKDILRFKTPIYFDK